MLLPLLRSPLLAGAGPLTFEQAVDSATQAPDVAGAREAARLQRRLAGEVPRLTVNPTVLVQPQARAVDSRGMGPELQAGVAQAFNLSGLGEARRAAALGEAAAAEAQAEVQALDKRLSAAAAWMEQAEVFVSLKPRDACRPGLTKEALIAEMEQRTHPPAAARRPPSPSPSRCASTRCSAAR
ncbi:MAG: hypothetical protein FJ086_19060 [Deltaproteobacteria bacterium]|nr:hypothetical protein [Deltaproteobacteria bacterium]